MQKKFDLVTYNKDYSLNNKSNKNIIDSIIFVKTLSKSLYLKNIWVIKKHITQMNNILTVYLEIYYTTAKTTSFKKRCLDKNTNKKIQNLRELSYLFKNKITLINSKIINANKKIDAKTATFFFKKLKKFVKLIFIRKFFLFLDLIKILSLFNKSNFSVELLLKIISITFKYISKKAHNRFLIFLDFLFNLLIEKEYINIRGIKFSIAGRLQGKMRKSKKCITKGSISKQSFLHPIFFSKNHVHTILGSFGLKIWVSFKNNL
jgi:hypothetical protein